LDDRDHTLQGWSTMPGIDHRRRVGSGAGRGFDTSGEAVVPFHERGLAALA